MADKDTEHLREDDLGDQHPREDDRGDELDESPVPDPEAKDTTAEDDPQAD